MKISIIIPFYNESSVIEKCLISLRSQTRDFELILVDDGSIDDTFLKISKFSNSQLKPRIFKQDHKGPASARNAGAKRATGEILVFVDSDMTFAPDFLEKLVQPIEAGSSKGTFTKEEYVANWDVVWARCWNYNIALPDKRRIPKDYPVFAPVFRAILASEFKKVHGFTEGIGWTDDWSLMRKLGYKSQATSAVCYHANPDTLEEVYKQAQWIGKNEFISGNIVRRVFNIFRHSFVVSIIVGFFGVLRYQTPAFIIFKLTYDFGISMGIVKSMIGDKNK